MSDSIRTVDDEWLGLEDGVLTEAEARELERLADEAELDPEGGIPWETVRAELLRSR